MNAPRDWIAEEALSVLVVDDVENNLALLSRLVSRLGHKVVLARDGAEAIARFQDGDPDLILMDIQMPVMDGFQTTAQIRALQGSRWVPVIYVTAHDLEGGLMQAIESGGDDYLTKPISAELLRAKLRAATRALGLQRENARQRAALERYYQAAEEEQKVASHLMRRLVQTDMLDDRAIQHRITPASHLSGDVIAAARTPGNALHVLLADGTGHGLAASLSVMPVVQPFYAMTEKGFGLPAIVREVNRKVREWSPIGRFVAATFVSVDAREAIVSVWNGGNPPVIKVNEQGEQVHRFLSRHLPLGIASDDSMDDSVERMSFARGDQLIACSDGVVEALSPSGEEFGIERLAQAGSRARGEQRMHALNVALNEHLAGAAAHDDLSLIVIDCSAAPEQERDSVAVGAKKLDHMVPAWRFRVELSSDDVRTTDVVARFTGTMERMGVPERDRTSLFVVLSELYSNALDHGLLLLDSRLKTSDRSMERYANLRSKRLRSLKEGSIVVELEMDIRRRKQVLIRVKDSGDGFDWRTEFSKAGSDAPKRGLGLVQALCSSLHYEGCGNDVVAVYELDTSA